jgi:hypothetical protein
MRKTLPLILAAIIMPSCAVVVISSSMSLATSRASLDETKMGLIYRCAFLAGQYSTMNSIPALFPEKKSSPSYCKTFEDIAVKDGFKGLSDHQ